MDIDGKEKVVEIPDGVPKFEGKRWISNAKKFREISGVYGKIDWKSRESTPKKIDIFNS